MKIPMQPITIVVISFVFVSSIFLCGYTFSLADESLELENYSKGRVLGASEVYTDSVKDHTQKLSLPKSKDIKISVPVIKSDGENFSLGNCKGLALDEGSDKILFQEKADSEVSIASITKLATALVFLDINPEWDSYYKLKPEDRVYGGRIYVIAGEEIKIDDLFHLSLIGSANTATQAIVSSTGLGEDEFVTRMNLKMEELGLTKTHFEDPIGLGVNNISTAFEVAKLAKVAFGVEKIQKITLTKNYSFNTKKGRKIIVNSTDSLLNSYPNNDVEVLAGKTGYTNSAGYCFVGKFSNNENHEIITVILGGENIYTRFKETKRLVNWSYSNYIW